MKRHTVSQTVVPPLAFALLFAVMLVAPAWAAWPTSSTCWDVTGSLTWAWHQYYDVPAWNSNGSRLLMIQHKDGQIYKAWYITTIPVDSSEAPTEIALPNLTNSTRSYHLQWHSTDPDLIYCAYFKHTEVPTAMDVYEINVVTNTSVRLRKFNCNTTERLQFAPMHPDGNHLLFGPPQGTSGAMRIIGTAGSDRGIIKHVISVSELVHRVRFTKASDLSIYYNEEPTANSRKNFILNTDGTKTVIYDGDGGHPDWKYDGSRWSLIRTEGASAGTLEVRTRTGALSRSYPGFLPHAHASWMPNGERIILDVYPGDYSEPYAGKLMVVDPEVAPPPAQTYGEFISNTHASYNDGKQYRHAHALYSPDGTKVVFNSDNDGAQMPRVFVARVRKPSVVTAISKMEVSDGVQLSWTRPNAKETKCFNIHMKISGSYTLVATVGASETTAVVEGALLIDEFAVQTEEFSSLKSNLAYAQ